MVISGFDSDFMGNKTKNTDGNRKETHGEKQRGEEKKKIIIKKKCE